MVKACQRHVLTESQSRIPTRKILSWSCSQEFISSTIIDALRSVIGDPDWTDFSVPFMDMGLDSLSVVEFRNLVQASFEGVHLASTALCREFASDDVTEDVGLPVRL